MSIRRLAAIALAVATLGVGAVAPVSAAPSATNDAFADAVTIPAGGLPYEWERDTTGATVESGEPEAPCDVSYNSTVWFRFTPTTTQYVRADTIGTDGSYLAVYRGGAIDSLTLVDCDNSASSASSDERVVWRAKAGVTYRIRVDSASRHAILRLFKVPPPKNDDFAKATAVTSFPTTFVTDIMNASREAGEPGPECASRGGNSIWYTVKVPTTRTIQVDATYAMMDSYLLVTTGSTVGDLDVIGCSDDISEVGSGSRYTFTAKAGKTYRILLAGYRGYGGKVTVVFRSVTPPANDAFAKAKTIIADGSTVKGDTTNATIQAGEPLTADGCDNEHVGSTVWYTFVAELTGTHRVDTYGSWPGTTIGIYTGSSLGTLSAMACDNVSSAEFFADFGTRYYIQIGGYDADSGPIRLHLTD